MAAIRKRKRKKRARGWADWRNMPAMPGCMVSGYCWGQGEGSVPDSASLSLVARAGFPFEGVRTTGGRDCFWEGVFLAGTSSGSMVLSRRGVDTLIVEGRQVLHVMCAF